MENKIRLQVFLSRAGIASRRKSASIIEDGRVLVNGQVIRERGYAVNPDKDNITADGKKVAFDRKIYILFNKPKGVITSRCDSDDIKTVFDILPPEFRRLHSVGRLDNDTTGLLLLTNDGELTYRLTHPKFEIHKRYKVRCRGKLEDKEKQCLERGMFIEGRKTSRAKVEIIRSSGEVTDLFIEIHEGRKRQISNMFLFLGHPIKQLERVSYEFLKLGLLKKGDFRYLGDHEVKRLWEL